MSQNSSVIDRSKDSKSETSKLSACLVPNTVTTTYSAVPWYLGGGTDPSMTHQKAFSNRRQLSARQKTNQATQMYDETKLRKWHPGCCNNCGVSSHKTKDCIELPRKKTAMKTGTASSIFNGRNSQAENQRGTMEMKALSKRILSNPKYENSYQSAHVKHSKYTLREIDETPAYLQPGVLSFDPRTHAIRKDSFQYLKSDEKLNAMADTRERLEAIRKFDLIGASAILPSKLDEAYHHENLGHVSVRPENPSRAAHGVSATSHTDHQSTKSSAAADSCTKEYVPR
mmetsp:Transcript_32952/g.51517  ORF Transcript_32952/g.51517 Transcript_32952/m.51517 type:complete len:285 (-) Transcript_32952:24-878(-)